MERHCLIISRDVSSDSDYHHFLVTETEKGVTFGEKHYSRRKIRSSIAESKGYMEKDVVVD